MILTKSGISIYYQQYSPDSIIKNQVMVSAFFSAMFSFSNNLGGALKLLRLGSRQFVVKESPDLLFIALIDTDDDVSDTTIRLDQLNDYIYENYEKFINKKTFNGNLSHFSGMGEYIDKIVKEQPICKDVKNIITTLEEIKRLINSNEKGSRAKLNKLLDEKIKQCMEVEASKNIEENMEIKDDPNPEPETMVMSKPVGKSSDEPEIKSKSKSKKSKGKRKKK